ncbi:amidase [Aaosphaeria arxii CBS 175.79]|uniref:amidase n=1 Tax=Aaosphaeria arxii CBS 175.79 TaxID=1450172 RepID=A0A6A5XHU3_9PLEO|nr:amidase [Aaosphaeria arxii CBS 175.79]KAF2012427.1 amidase [Aaosphaeria arxii CBS 175.79]
MPPKKPSNKRSWQAIASEAQAHRDSTIAELSPSVPGLPEKLPKDVTSLPKRLLDETTISITDLPPDRLLDSLASGHLSAVTVTKAYLQRAAVSQGLVNCLTELLPRLALQRAGELDVYLKEHGKPIGPLHGLPISVKEHIGFKGLRCSTGYIGLWDNIAKEDAHILQLLNAAGAVFHCRTTIPQTMMHLETDSNLYGVTVNPYNVNLTSGGSSGGEGALVALHGSCLGIGSDVGGSIRSPAANCGIYGFKPTAFRIPTDGWGYMMAGADTVESVLGPLSTTVSGLHLFMKTIIDAEPWRTEPALIPLPWREIILTEKLKIGVLWHDDVVKPHPPITRALRQVADRLRGINVEVVDFPARLHDEAWAILASLYYTDGGEYDTETIDSAGEPWRPLSTWMLKENPCVQKLTVGELTYWLEEREAYRKEYAIHWNNLDVDAILCPVGPGVAPKHNTAKYWWYTSQWNLLDYPGAVFPVTKVNKEIDKPEGRGKFLSDLDEANSKLYDPQEFHGLPISLQLVGRRFEDEKVLKILEYITHRISLPC